MKTAQNALKLVGKVKQRAMWSDVGTSRKRKQVTNEPKSTEMVDYSDEHNNENDK